MRDGTFGTPGRCPPFEPELIEALEGHHFDPVRVLQWRNRDLDFASLASLQAASPTSPASRGSRARRSPRMWRRSTSWRARTTSATSPRAEAAVERLWEVCQIPDYRKISPAEHADLVAQLYRFLDAGRRDPDDWFARQVAMVDRTDGDIDTLSNRIAQVRTWTFVANRPDWLRDPEHWQA